MFSSFFIKLGIVERQWRGGLKRRCKLHRGDFNYTTQKVVCWRSHRLILNLSDNFYVKKDKKSKSSMTLSVTIELFFWNMKIFELHKSLDKDSWKIYWWGSNLFTFARGQDWKTPIYQVVVVASSQLVSMTSTSRNTLCVSSLETGIRWS